jgi:hypothetical protein
MPHNAVHKYQKGKEVRFAKHVEGWRPSSSSSVIQKAPYVRQPSIEAETKSDSEMSLAYIFRKLERLKNSPIKT